MKKTFIFDLDGTLLNSQKLIHELNLAALQRLHDSGHTIIIATGRNYSQLLDFINPLKMVTYFVTLNGGAIYNSHTQQLEFISKPLDTNLVHEVVNLTQQIKRELQFSNFDRLYRVYFGKSILEDITEPNFFKDATKNPKYDNWDEVKHLIDEPIIRIAIRCEKVHRLKLYDYLHNKYAIKRICNIEQSSNAYIECDPCGISKFNTVKLIMDRLHLDIDGAYAFGDSENDLCLFEHIPNSVCMANAQQHIKLHAKHIIDDNNTTSISTFLNRIN